MKIEIENEHTFKAALSEGINLFLGSAFSIRSKSTYFDFKRIKKSDFLPIGNKLSEEIINQFSIPHLAKLNLAKLSTIVKKNNRIAFENYLKERFTITWYDKRYDSILDFNIKSIFTTNIDDLIPCISKKHNSKYLHDVTIRGGNNDSNSIKYFPLHGSVTHENPDYKFTTEELVTTFAKDKDLFFYLSKEIQNSPTLFWGYSLDDPSIIEALSNANNTARGDAPKWIVLKSSDPASEEYFKAHGFNIIIADTDTLLDYLEEHAKNIRVNEVETSDFKSLFPDYYIPSNSETKVRPLTDFFSGDDPEWYDVYQPLICKTNHFDKLKNSINSGRHTLFLGIPGSGKSTLLKQLAIDFKNRNNCLFVKLITKEQINLIKSKIYDKKVIIFVDDFADDIEAFKELMNLTNVQVVGCAREFMFEIVSHYIDQSAVNIHNVSDLSSFDIQAIFDKIPKSIRKENLHISSNESDQSLSFFELIEQNTRMPTLKKRMNDALDHIKKSEVTLYKSLIAISYVQSCGTPMTNDMLFAFSRPFNITIQEIPNKINKLGSMLREYSGVHADNSQDNYFIRSKLMADAIMELVTPKDFRDVFEQFHEEVSPYRIIRFDIFRRRAFDERFVTKAFEKWEDGLAFYENSRLKDNSAELIQQGALYLSRKNQNKLAFQWIDEAKLIKPGSFSVRNSHAIILFRANIDLAKNDKSVLPTLVESMNILEDCYNSDRRKAYHAFVFTEQAISIHKIFGLEVSENFLILAKKWLKLEAKSNISSRRANKLLGQINRLI